MPTSQTSVWGEYEAKWVKFVSFDVVTLASIPWPPHSEKLLQWEVQRQQQSHEYRAKIKSAYKKCALRWHPDKFMGKHGSKMVDSEKEEIHKRVNDIFQTLNASLTAALKNE